MTPSISGKREMATEPLLSQKETQYDCNTHTLLKLSIQNRSILGITQWTKISVP